MMDLELERAIEGLISEGLVTEKFENDDLVRNLTPSGLDEVNKLLGYKAYRKAFVLIKLGFTNEQIIRILPELENVKNE